MALLASSASLAFLDSFSSLACVAHKASLVLFFVGLGVMFNSCLSQKLHLMALMTNTHFVSKWHFVKVTFSCKMLVPNCKAKGQKIHYSKKQDQRPALATERGPAGTPLAWGGF